VWLDSERVLGGGSGPELFERLIYNLMVIDRLLDRTSGTNLEVSVH